MRSTTEYARRLRFAALVSALASASILAACEDEPDNVGEAIEELGDEIEDEVDDNT